MLPVHNLCLYMKVVHNMVKCWRGTDVSEVDTCTCCPPYCSHLVSDMVSSDMGPQQLVNSLSWNDRQCNIRWPGEGKHLIVVGNTWYSFLMLSRFFWYKHERGYEEIDQDYFDYFILVSFMFTFEVGPIGKQYYWVDKSDTLSCPYSGF